MFQVRAISRYHTYVAVDFVGERCMQYAHSGGGREDCILGYIKASSIGRAVLIAMVRRWSYYPLRSRLGIDVYVNRLMELVDIPPFPLSEPALPLVHASACIMVHVATL